MTCGGAVADRVRNAHAVLAQQPELRVPVRVVGREHAAVAGAHDLARDGTRSRRCRRCGRPIFSQLPVPGDLAADGAGGVLDDAEIRAVRAIAKIDCRSQGMPIWCTHRIARVRGVIAASISAGIDVEGRRLDVDKHRRRAAVADDVGGGDEGVADRDHLVARPDAEGQQRQMQRRRAVRNGAGMRRADELRELPLEGRDLRSLRDPAAEDDAARRVGLALVHARAW